MRERREFGGPIETAASDQPDIAVLDAGEQAVPVVFDLMQPFGSIRRLICDTGELRLQIGGHRALAGAGDGLRRPSLRRLRRSIGFAVPPVRMPDPVAIGGDRVERAPGRDAEWIV